MNSLSELTVILVSLKIKQVLLIVSIDFVDQSFKVFAITQEPDHQPLIILIDPLMIFIQLEKHLGFQTK